MADECSKVNMVVRIKKLGPRARLLGVGAGDHSLNLVLSGKSHHFLPTHLQ